MVNWLLQMTQYQLEAVKRHKLKVSISISLSSKTFLPCGPGLPLYQVNRPTSSKPRACCRLQHLFSELTGVSLEIVVYRLWTWLSLYTYVVVDFVVLLPVFNIKSICISVCQQLRLKPKRRISSEYFTLFLFFICRSWDLGA